MPREAAAEAGVSLSENLTGPVFVNQTAAFSDYHGTGPTRRPTPHTPTPPSSRTASAS